jgi:Family of unknown function (DUF6325)
VSQVNESPTPPTGPVDCVVVSFPGSKFKGDIVPAIKRLVDAGIVRILDLVFIQKSEEGDVTVVELSDLGGDESAAFDALDGEVDELLTEEDIEGLSELWRRGMRPASWCGRTCGPPRRPPPSAPPMARWCCTSESRAIK